jgi:hypothetical protein
MLLRLILLLMLVWVGPFSSACACIGFEAKMASQENLIVWDQEKGIEHFIRRATFGARGERLGFVAPTPSIPELGEIDNQLFNIATDIATRNFYSEENLAALGDIPIRTGAPEIVQTSKIAGYKAVTLRASNKKEIEQWIKENKLESFSGLSDWFDFYIEKNWYLTFFLVEKDPRSESFGTGTVRMSFKTVKPFNPYYVPKQNWDKFAKLRLYFISQTPYMPERDFDMREMKQLYVQFRLSQPAFDLLLKNMEGVNVSFQRPIMYALEDSDFANSETDDLYFAPSSSNGIRDEVPHDYEPKSVKKYLLPGVIIGSIVGIAIALKARRMRVFR